MDTKDISPSFKAYLTQVSELNALNHVLECLIHGDSDSEAWKLMKITHGEDWSCPSHELPQYILEAVKLVREGLVREESES